MCLHLDDAYQDKLLERSKNVHQSLHFSNIHDDLKVFMKTDSSLKIKLCDCSVCPL